MYISEWPSNNNNMKHKCEPGFHYMTETDAVNNAMKQKREEDGGENKSEGGRESSKDQA